MYGYNCEDAYLVFCVYAPVNVQMIDLRWGIREQSHDDHTIIDFCLKEIENCKKVSLGPSFVVGKRKLNFYINQSIQIRTDLAFLANQSKQNFIIRLPPYNDCLPIGLLYSI